MPAPILAGMVIVSLLVPPVLMLAAVGMERRRGASAGGWVAALPVSLPVAVLAVALGSGAHMAEELTWSAGAHVPAQVMFALGFAAGLRRGSVPRGLAGGIAAYVTASLVIAFAPDGLGAAAAAPVLLLASRLLPARAAAAPPPRRPATTALTCLGASTVVAAAVFGSRYAGPGVAGALAAFPTVTGLFVLLVAGRGGAAAGAQVLAGLVRSLPCYLTFCVLAAGLMPRLGASAVPLAILAGLATSGVTWRGLARAQGQTGFVQARVPSGAVTVSRQ